MVNILFDRYDLESGKMDSVILNQIKTLARNVSPARSTKPLRLKIGVQEVEIYK